ncbi:MAG TPA: hypothetical protein VGG33_14975 [Polyangia bacterium]
MSFHDEDEIPEEEVLGGGAVGSIIEATLSHRRGVLGALGSAGLVATGPTEREDLLQSPEVPDDRQRDRQRPPRRRLILW